MFFTNDKAFLDPSMLMTFVPFSVKKLVPRQEPLSRDDGPGRKTGAEGVSGFLIRPRYVDCSHRHVGCHKATS